MEYGVFLADSFKNDLRRLKKRFHHVVDDVREAIRDIEEDPLRWPVAPHCCGMRKARVANSDASKGRSGGYRLYYFVLGEPTPVVVFVIAFSKGDMVDMSRSEVRARYAEVTEELGH